MRKLTHLFLFLFLFLSCSDDESSNSFVENKKVPLSIASADVGTDLFEYDSQQRLIKVTSNTIYSQESDYIWLTTIDIAYDSQNRISTISIEESGGRGTALSPTEKIKYISSYDKDKMSLEKIYEYGSFKGKSYFYDYSFDNQNRLIKIMSDNKVYASFEYDEKGNLTKRSTSDNTQEYEYDNTLGISRNVNTSFWLLNLLDSEHMGTIFSTTIVNNPISEKCTYNYNPTDSYTASINYTYDQNGIPLTYSFKGGDYYEAPYAIVYK